MLEIRDVWVSFDGLEVLRGIDLNITRGEIVSLLGPSGCGKTTLLRVIAGLEKPQSGDVLLNGQSIVNVPVHQRGFGLMFQDFALFPHLNVAENVAFGLRMNRTHSTARTARIAEVLELVGLSGFEKRDTADLSGGERQRVALARSLAPNPRLLMLDEPLGALDALLRERLILDLKNIIKKTGLTAVYVTHDQHEAFAISDRIALMNRGEIEQTGTPQDIYRDPNSSFTARFLGLENIFPIISWEDGTAHTRLGDFPVAHAATAVLLHPDGIHLATSHSSGAISGTIHSVAFLGDMYRLNVVVGPDQTITFKVPSSVEKIPKIGDQIAVTIAPDSIIPLESA